MIRLRLTIDAVVDTEDEAARVLARLQRMGFPVQSADHDVRRVRHLQAVPSGEDAS